MFHEQADWLTSGAEYTDPAQLGAEPGPLVQFLQRQGVEAAMSKEGDRQASYKDDL